MCIHSLLLKASIAYIELFLKCKYISTLNSLYVFLAFNIMIFVFVSFHCVLQNERQITWIICFAWCIDASFVIMVFIVGVQRNGTHIGDVLTEHKYTFSINEEFVEVFFMSLKMMCTGIIILGGDQVL